MAVTDLAEHARTHLSKRRYKDAIDAYKRLLKKEPHGQWREGLAAAYLGRAGDLARKGMHQEALVFLEHRSALDCGEPAVALTIACQIGCGRTGEAARLYDSARETLSGPQDALLQSLFGARLVAGDDVLRQALPADSPMIRQHATLSAAIDAWCGGDDETAREYLKKIPYRSPYRDLRTILMAMLQQQARPEAAREQLARIDPDSPFAAVAVGVRVGMLEGAEWVEAVAALAPAARDFALALKGIDQERFAAISRVRTGAHSPKERLTLLTANARYFDAAAVRSACLDLLTLHPAGLKRVEQTIGPLPEDEKARLAARAAEQQGDWEKAFSEWRSVAIHLSSDDSPSSRLRCALIARHLADIQKEHFDPESETVEQLLTFSLTVDPDDKPSYLALLDYYRRIDRQTKQRQWMDRAVKQFPEDSDILTAAIELALARGTYKKAAGYAKRLLQLDPINREARGALVRAHLAHARKQIGAQKYHLVEKELSAALSFARNDSVTGLVQLHFGLLAFAKGHAEEGEIAIEKACRQLGDRRIGYLRFVIEAERLDLPRRTIKSYLALLKQSTASAPATTDILAVCQVLESYANKGSDDLGSALGAISKYLRKGAELDFRQEEMAALCSAFEKMQDYALLRSYAAHALAGWDAPLFVYFELYGKARGDLFRLNPADLDALQEALVLAMQRDEADTVQRIRTFLSQVERIDPGRILGQLGTVFDLEQDEEGEYEDELDLLRDLFQGHDKRPRR